MPERVRIEAPDALSATDLLYRLRSFDGRLVARDGGRFDVSVETAVSGRELNRLIDAVLDAVERWLAERGLDAAVVYVDGERYSLPRPRPAEHIV